MTHPLVRRLASREPAERCAACREAARDPAATLLAPALAEALGDADREVARAASDALVEIGRSVGGVEAVLREALHGDDATRRFGAAFTSARLEPPAPRLLPALVEALAENDGDVRWAATRILVDMGQLHGEVLPLLEGLLRADERTGVRRMAAHALRALAPDREETARALADATRDADATVRRAALTAAAALVDPPRALVERLAEVLEDASDPPARRLAALALASLSGGAQGPTAERTLAALREARASADPALERAIARALAKVPGGSAREEAT